MAGRKHRPCGNNMNFMLSKSEILPELSKVVLLLYKCLTYTGYLFPFILCLQQKAAPSDARLHRGATERERARGERGQEQEMSSVGTRKRERQKPDIPAV